MILIGQGDGVQDVAFASRKDREFPSYFKTTPPISVIFYAVSHYVFLNFM